jgi:hypothetical protein
MYKKMSAECCKADELASAHARNRKKICVFYEIVVVWK